MTHKTLFFSFITTMLITTSCTTSKKVVYMQDASTFARQKIGTFQIKIENADLIAVIVGSKDTVLARPFNRPPGGQGYTVSDKGTIDYPVFGEIRVAGATPAAVADTIKSMIIQGGHIKDPVVAVKLLNFKISVMGEVNRPGVFPVPSERVTVLEAISMAGDMSIYGRRDKVLIVREEDGIRDMQYLDVNSTAIFNSPYYYLKQNDLVYVEPNKAKAAQSDFDPRLPIYLAGATVLTSLASLIILIAK